MQVVEEILRIDIPPRARVGFALCVSIALSALAYGTACIMGLLLDLSVPPWASLLSVPGGVGLTLIFYHAILNHRRGRIREMCAAVAADAFQCSLDRESDLVLISHRDRIQIGSQSVEDEREIIHFTPREFAEVAAVLGRRGGPGELPVGRSLFGPDPEDPCATAVGEGSILCLAAESFIQKNPFRWLLVLPLRSRHPASPS